MADKKQQVVLNIGSQRISGARFSVGPKKSLVLRDYAFVELMGDPAADSSRMAQMQVALSELSNKLKIKKSTVVSYAMSGQSVFTRFVKLPPLGDENVDKLVAFEAQQNVPFPMNEVSWDYQFVGENAKGEVEAVLVAIKSDTLNEYNDVIEDTYLTVDRVDVAPMAIYNAFRYNYPSSGKPAVLIDIGARSTNLIYFDGERVFTRSIPVGGSLITSNIAKEFRVPFAQAEERKLADGFVALGGAYADHQDPEVAAMSKVIRETLGRLHSEVGRTNNFFRSQQGGRAPEVAYLCGGSAGLPYVQEFFEEKLNIPVEFFNPLQSVKVDPKLGDGVSTDAHGLGELVGLGLRGVGGCPMELNLVPDTVERRKDMASRKPFLILSALTLFSLLGSGIFFFKRAAAEADRKREAVAATQNELQGLDRKIKGLKKELDTLTTMSAPLEEAVWDRSYYVRLLSDLNSRFGSDLIWFTKIEPVNPARELTSSLWSGSGVSASWGGGNSNDGGGQASEGPPAVESLRILGLYRDNPSGEAVVNQLVESLKESPFLDLSALAEDRSAIVPHISSRIAGDPRWAYDFVLNLPLNQKIALNESN